MNWMSPGSSMYLIESSSVEAISRTQSSAACSSSAIASRPWTQGGGPDGWAERDPPAAGEDGPWLSLFVTSALGRAADPGALSDAAAEQLRALGYM